MLRIAIVDDEESFLEILEKKILELGLLDKTDEIKKYNSAEQFLFEYDENRGFDICLLDIEMSGCNGIELGKKIRSWHETTVIIYITAYARFAVEAYDAHAYHYILKSRISNKLPLVLQEVFNRMGKRREEYYVIETASRVEKICLEDIIYIYKQKKYCMFETKKGSYRERKTLTDLLYALQDKNFTLIDQGVIVNIARVDRVLKNELLMQNGETLGISRSNVKRVKQEIGDYWREHW